MGFKKFAGGADYVPDVKLLQGLVILLSKDIFLEIELDFSSKILYIGEGASAMRPYSYKPARQRNFPAFLVIINCRFKRRCFIELAAIRQSSVK